MNKIQNERTKVVLQKYEAYKTIAVIFLKFASPFIIVYVIYKGAGSNAAIWAFFLLLAFGFGWLAGSESSKPRF